MVMPNHIHSIIVLDKIDDGDDVRCTGVALHCTDVALQRLYDETNVNDGTNSPNKKMSKISPKPGSIPTILRSYKSVVTKNARKINPDYEWQERYHDHIIRNEKSFNNIRNYIKNNPANWIDDEFCDDEK